MNIERSFPIAAAFAEQNWASVTYQPKINEWDWPTQPARACGPEMYRYFC